MRTCFSCPPPSCSEGTKPSQRTGSSENSVEEDKLITITGSVGEIISSEFNHLALSIFTHQNLNHVHSAELEDDAAFTRYLISVLSHSSTLSLLILLLTAGLGFGCSE